MLIRNPPVEVAGKLFMLGTNEYPMYLFRGESHATIFEGGTGSMARLLDQQLERLGIPRSSVRQLVITHAHPDHVMAVPRLRETFPSLTVLASEIAAKALSSPKAIAFFRQIDDALSDSLGKAGIIAEEHRPPPVTADQIAVDRTLKEGDALAVEPGTRFEVLETPGHSDCSLSFHEPKGRVLLISDATGYYLPEHEAWWPNYFSDYGAYVESMERLSALGAEVLCLSHNGAIRGASDVKAYFDGAIAATREYHGRIVREAEAGKSPREIAEELGAEVYEKTQLLPLEFFQKNCGLLVKMSMRHAGVVPEK